MGFLRGMLKHREDRAACTLHSIPSGLLPPLGATSERIRSELTESRLHKYIVSPYSRCYRLVSHSYVLQFNSYINRIHSKTIIVALSFACENCYFKFFGMWNILRKAQMNFVTSYMNIESEIATSLLVIVWRVAV